MNTILSIYDWIYGIAQLAAAFLAVLAGIIALSMFYASHKRRLLRPWVPLLIALILFTAEEILGGIKTFGIFSTPHLTHVVPSFILGFLIIALVMQGDVARGAK